MPARFTLNTTFIHGKELIDLLCLYSFGRSSWGCRVYSSFIASTFSNVCLGCCYIKISHWMVYHSNMSSRYWRGRQLLLCLVFCIALSKIVRMRRLLFGCQSRLVLYRSLLKHRPVYFSTLCSCIRCCFLEADTAVAAPSLSGVRVGCVGLLHLLHLNGSLCQLSIGPFLLLHL